MKKEQSITRRLLSDDTFRKIHDAWSLENDELLVKHKEDWNFGIIIRNHTRDAFDKMIERAIKLNNSMKTKDQKIEEAKEFYCTEIDPAMKIYDATIYPYQVALGDAQIKAMKIRNKTVVPAWQRLQMKLKEIEKL